MRRREIGAIKERSVGWLLMGGLILSIVSGALFCLMFMASALKGGIADRAPGFATVLNFFPLTIIGFALGLLMMLAGVGYGLWSHKTEHKGLRRVETEFRILSRYCYDRTHQLLSEDFDIEIADRPKFYVRAMLGSGLVGEFQTTIEVFYQAGEGMVGEAEIQGKWLGRFIPYIGRPSNS